MRKAVLYYLEVLNETEQVLIFTVDFNNKKYGVDLILNTALSVQVQDVKIRKTIAKLEGMTRVDAKEAL